MCKVSEKNIHWCWRYASGRTKFSNIMPIWASKMAISRYCHYRWECVITFVILSWALYKYQNGSLRIAVSVVFTRKRVRTDTNGYISYNFLNLKLRPFYHLEFYHLQICHAVQILSYLVNANGGMTNSVWLNQFYIFFHQIFWNFARIFTICLCWKLNTDGWAQRFFQFEFDTNIGNM